MPKRVKVINIHPHCIYHYILLKMVTPRLLIRNEFTDGRAGKMARRCFGCCCCYSFMERCVLNEGIFRANCSYYLCDIERILFAQPTIVPLSCCPPTHELVFLNISYSSKCGSAVYLLDLCLTKDLTSISNV